MNEKDFVIIDGVLIKYTGDDKDVIIPDDVVWIKQNAFDGRDDIRSVTIPENVTAVGQRCFCNCSFLERLTIEGDVCFAADSFEGCNNIEEINVKDEKMKQHLIDVVNLPEGCDINVSTPFLGQEYLDGKINIESDKTTEDDKSIPPQQHDPKNER